jgi:hypothetical protein
LAVPYEKKSGHRDSVCTQGLPLASNRERCQKKPSLLAFDLGLAASRTEKMSVVQAT